MRYLNFGKAVGDAKLASEGKAEMSRFIGRIKDMLKGK